MEDHAGAKNSNLIAPKRGIFVTKCNSNITPISLKSQTRVSGSLNDTDSFLVRSASRTGIGFEHSRYAVQHVPHRFPSDLHLGTTRAQSEALLDFLKVTECETLYLVGDEFDSVVLHARWLAHLGDWAYEVMVDFNLHFNRLRRTFGLPYTNGPQRSEQRDRGLALTDPQAKRRHSGDLSLTVRLRGFYPRMLTLSLLRAATTG